MLPDKVAVGAQATDDPVTTVWLDGRPSVVGMQLTVVIAATAATVLGAIAGTTLVRGKSLFRYVKDR